MTKRSPGETTLFYILVFLLISLSLVFLFSYPTRDYYRYRYKPATDSLVGRFYTGTIDYSKTPDPLVFLCVKVYADVLRPSFSNLNVIAVSADNTVLPLELYYDGNKPRDYSGQIFGNDNDQYAHYYFAIFTKPRQFSYIEVSPLNQVNYVSVIIGDYKTLTLFRTIQGDSGKSVYTFNDQKVPNPFVHGNDTTNCFPLCKPNNRKARYFLLANLPHWIIDSIRVPQKILPDTYRPSDGRIGVYRVDAETSQQSFIPENERTSCFDDYLFTSVQYRQTHITKFDENDYIGYGILRVPVFHGYVTTKPCGVWDAGFDTAYYSISFHVTNKIKNPPMLPFWTINLRMLEQIADKDGYAYIFWAPYQDVVSRMSSPTQNTPPIVQWGNRRGALFQTPTGRIIFRYKQVNKDWKGYPGNAICYCDDQSNRAITDQLTDKSTGINYCPSVYGQSFSSLEEFLQAPSIGAVPRDGDWPVSSL